MTVEFMRFEQSSEIHFGPNLPIPGMSEKTGHLITNIKSWFFLCGIFLQLFLFLLISIGYIQMPSSDTDLQIGIVDEISHSEHSDDATEDLDFSVHQRKFPLGVTLSFIENGYIILWTSKDYFWSWATGDFPIDQNDAYFTQIIALVFGLLSIVLFTYVSYLWRYDTINFLDSVTCWCWLCADFMWMIGEIVIRYKYTQLDDENQADDSITRIISTVFFSCGLLLQLGIFVYFALAKRKSLSSSHQLYAKVELTELLDDKIDVVSVQSTV
jgi:hypothetical protein